MLQAGWVVLRIAVVRAEYNNSRQFDGTVVVFDVETNGVARKLRGHTRQIQSLRYDKQLRKADCRLNVTAGLAMEDTYSVLRKTGSVCSGIFVMVQGYGLFALKLPFTSPSFILIISMLKHPDDLITASCSCSCV